MRLFFLGFVLFLAFTGLAGASATFFRPVSEAYVFGGRYLTKPPSVPCRHCDASLSSVIAFDFAGLTLQFEHTNTHEQLLCISNISLLMYWHNNSGETALHFNSPHRFLCRVELSSSQASNTTWNSVIDTSAQVLDHSPTPFAVPYPVLASDICLHTNDQLRIQITHITEPDFNHIEFLPNYVEIFGLFGELAPTPVALQHNRVMAKQSEVYFKRSSHQQMNRARIEFIGDSITAGFCNRCHNPPFPNATEYALEDFSMAWAHRTCRYFDADCHVEAWSGYGMLENCCGGNITMPKILNRTLASVANSTWNFQNFPTSERKRIANDGADEHQSQWGPPHVVVINLGTNDYNDPHRPENLNVLFQDAYFRTVSLLVHMYHNATTHRGPEFFFACGPMSTAYCDDVFQLLERCARSFGPNTTYGSNFTFLDQRNVLNEKNMCCGHPDTAADEILANITIGALEKVIVRK